jgi:acetyl-CoA synthetase
MKEVYPVPAEFEKTARTNEQEYFERYQKSIETSTAKQASDKAYHNHISPIESAK